MDVTGDIQIFAIIGVLVVFIVALLIAMLIVRHRRGKLPGESQLHALWLPEDLLSGARPPDLIWPGEAFRVELGSTLLHPRSAEPGVEKFVLREYATPLQTSAREFYSAMRIGKAYGDYWMGAGIYSTRPLALYGDGETVVAAASLQLPQRFRFGEKRRTLGVALRNGPEKLSGPEVIEILRMTAVLYDSLHHGGFAYGGLPSVDLSWCVTDGHVELAVENLETLRAIGDRVFPAKDLPNDPEWADPLPEPPGMLPPAYDLDRYHFALLAYRMLADVPNPAVATFPTDEAQIVRIRLRPGSFGLDGYRLHGLVALFRRSARVTQVGSRPSLCEWLHYLGDPAHQDLPVRVGRR